MRNQPQTLQRVTPRPQTNLPRRQEFQQLYSAADENGSNLVIKIKDDGKGIAPDMIGRIFEPLVTTKRGQGGTGLGLAITRRIVHASDGEVTVASTPGNGAEFTITLPRQRIATTPGFTSMVPSACSLGCLP